MAKNLIWIITVAVTALIQTTWPDALKIQGVLPDLTLLLVVYFAISEGEERAMFTGLLGGIYQDVASNAVLGHHVLCHVIVGFIVGRVSTRLVTEHPAVKAGLTFLAGVVHGILYTGIGYVQEPDFLPAYTIVTAVVPGAFYTALLTPIAFAMLGWIFHRRQAVQGGLA